MTDRNDRIVLVLSVAVRAADVRAIAEARNWTREGDTPRAHLALASRRYRTPEGAEVLEIEDHNGGVRSLRISGPTRGELARALAGQLPTRSTDEIIATASSSDPVACIRAAGELAASRPARFDPPHLAALQRLLTHPEPAVRRAGIRAAYGCQWPELRRWLGARMQAETRLASALAALVSWIDETSFDETSLDETSDDGEA